MVLFYSLLEATTIWIKVQSYLPMNVGRPISKFSVTIFHNLGAENCIPGVFLAPAHFISIYILNFSKSLESLQPFLHFFFTALSEIKSPHRSNSVFLLLGVFGLKFPDPIKRGISPYKQQWAKLKTRLLSLKTFWTHLYLDHASAASWHDSMQKWPSFRNALAYVISRRTAYVYASLLFGISWRRGLIQWLASLESNPFSKIANLAHFPPQLAMGITQLSVCRFVIEFMQLQWLTWQDTSTQGFSSTPVDGVHCTKQTLRSTLDRLIASPMQPTDVNLMRLLSSRDLPEM